MVPKIRTYNNSEILTGICKECGIKPIEEFPISSIRNDIIYYRNMCKHCFLIFRSQCVLLESNGALITVDYMDNYTIETDEFWVHINCDFNPDIDIKHKKSGRVMWGFDTKTFYDITNMPKPEELTGAEQIDRILNRFFNLRAFL